MVVGEDQIPHPHLMQRLVEFGLVEPAEAVLVDDRVLLPWCKPLPALVT